MFMIIKSIGSVLQWLYQINITIERCVKLFDLYVLRIIKYITDIEIYFRYSSVTSVNLSNRPIFNIAQPYLPNGVLSLGYRFEYRFLRQKI